MEKYDEIIKDQMKLGIVEIIEDSSVIGEIFHYLPHAVISPEKSTTKIRIVYDGSAKEKKGNLSLNENFSWTDINGGSRRWPYVN